MEEQSHKDEMRVALRGDFERLRARRARPSRPPQQAAADRGASGDELAAPEQGAVARERTPSWAGRILGRR